MPYKNNFLGGSWQLVIIVLTICEQNPFEEENSLIGAHCMLIHIKLADGVVAVCTEALQRGVLKDI